MPKQDSTAAKILARHDLADFSGQRKLEAELLEIASSISGANCFDREWKFSDGSVVRKTRTGFVALSK